jgi:hypothetical protein
VRHAGGGPDPPLRAEVWGPSEEIAGMILISTVLAVTGLPWIVSIVT